jgi:ribosome-associated toxin RatA of RatAB toxin-antitoxin module
MAQAQKSIVIEVPAEKLYEVIADYGKYPEFLAEAKKVDVKPDGESVLVTYTIDIKATKITYTLRHTGKRPTEVKWTLVKGEMMKVNNGSWTLKDLGGGRTDATYAIELKLGALVPGFVEKMLAEQNLPTTLAAFKQRAEKLHPRG